MSIINFIKSEKHKLIVLDPMDKPNEEFEKLPNGVYKVTEVGGMFDRKIAFQDYPILDSLIKFKSGTFTEIIKKCDDFFNENTKNKYLELNLIRKMGLLLYGPPGTGKTSLSILIMNEISKKHNAICLDCTGYSINFIKHVISKIRIIQDNSIILFCDEFENLVINSEMELLTFLDGSNSVNDLIFIGCTNYLEKIPTRIRERKSRIKNVYLIKSLPDSVYREYILNKIKNISDIDLNKIVYLSVEKGLTIDELKHALIDWVIEDIPIDKAIDEAKKYESIN